MGEVPTSLKVVKKIAELEEVHSTDLDFCLGEYIDTGALNLLCSEDSPAVRVQFEVPNYTVIVRATVEVTRKDGTHRGR